MTTNLFVFANVKQLRTDGSFRILLPFFRTSGGVGFLNSTIFDSFYNRVEFGTILEGLRNFGGGAVEHHKPPATLGTPLVGGILRKLCPCEGLHTNFLESFNSLHEVIPDVQLQHLET